MSILYDRHRHLAPAIRLLGVLGLTLTIAACGGMPLGSKNSDPRPATALNKTLAKSFQAERAWQLGFGKGTQGSQLQLQPAVEANRVYAADASGRVIAADASSGRVLWQQRLDLPLSAGPDVAGNSLVLGSTEGDLIALSTADGNERWRTQLSSGILAVPSIIGDLVVVHSIDDDVFGVDLADGSIRWQYAYSAPALTLHGNSTPIPAGDGVLIGKSGGKLVKLELDRGLPLWETLVTRPSGRSELERITDIDVDPLVIGDRVYVAVYNGDLAAVNLNSGELLWRRELSSHAGLAADDSSLYVTDSDDGLWAATLEDGSALWHQEALRYREITAPQIAGRLLFVGDSEGYLHWFSIDGGRYLGYQRIGKDAISHRPVLSGGQVFLQTDDGSLTALRLPGASAASGTDAGSNDS